MSLSNPEPAPVANQQSKKVGDEILKTLLALRQDPRVTKREKNVKITDLVIVDTRDRIAHGLKTYETELMTFNGRDALKDLYQEALDFYFYGEQKLMEIKGDLSQIELALKLIQVIGNNLEAIHIIREAIYDRDGK